MVSTALIRGCVMDLRALASDRLGITSMGNSNRVDIVSTARVRGVIMGLMWFGREVKRRATQFFIVILEVFMRTARYGVLRVGS